MVVHLFKDHVADCEIMSRCLAVRPFPMCLVSRFCVNNNTSVTTKSRHRSCAPFNVLHRSSPTSIHRANSSGSSPQMQSRTIPIPIFPPSSCTKTRSATHRIVQVVASPSRTDRGMHAPNFSCAILCRTGRCEDFHRDENLWWPPCNSRKCGARAQHSGVCVRRRRRRQ